MIRINLAIKPLSINKAYQGRRFKTAEAKKYERTLQLLLPIAVAKGPLYEVRYFFSLINWSRTDQQNLLKLLTDALVRKGIIKDDRYICREVIEKRKADKDSIYLEVDTFDPPR